MISRQKDHEKFAGFVQVFFVDLLLQKARLVMTSGLAQSSVFSKSSFLVTLMFCISPNRVLPLRRRNQRGRKGSWAPAQRNWLNYRNIFDESCDDELGIYREYSDLGVSKGCNSQLCRFPLWQKCF